MAPNIINTHKFLFAKFTALRKIALYGTFNGNFFDFKKWLITTCFNSQ